MDILERNLDLMDRVKPEVAGDLECVEDDNDSVEGKKYQNENIYNKFLPYDISAESQEHLMRIKTSLARCVVLEQEVIYDWFMDLERSVSSLIKLSSNTTNLLILTTLVDFPTQIDLSNYMVLPSLKKITSILLNYYTNLSSQKLAWTYTILPMQQDVFRN